MLVAMAYQNESQEKIIYPRQTREVLDASQGYLAAAEQLEATTYIVINAVHVGERTVVTAALYDAQGAPVHTVKMTAKTIDDFEPVSDRLVKALLHRDSVEDVRNLRNISNNEGARRNKLYFEK